MYFPVQPFYILFVAVSGRVHKVLASRAIADNAHTLSRQSVLHFFHRSFISGHNRSRENDSVPLLQGEFRVGFVSSAIKRGEFFTLRASHQYNHFVRRVILHFLDRDNGAFFGPEESRLDGHLDICLHRAPVRGYFFTQSFRYPDHVR